MWEALINWINSKAYRCEHHWEQIKRTDVYETADSKLPHATKFAYRCTKCCNFKKSTI